MRKLYIAIAVVGLAGLTIFALVVGCGKKPSEPQPVVDKEYKAYFIDEISHYQYYYYSTATGLVDSFYLPYNSYESGIAISPDGKTMYLNPDGFIVEVSLDSHKVIAEHPVSFSNESNLYLKTLVVSPNGKYLAILNRNLVLLDLTDHSVIYEQEEECYSGRFSTEGSLFTCIIRDSIGTDVVVYDLATDSVEIDRDFNYGIPYKVIYSESREMWFLYYSLGTNLYRFQAVDEKTDSVVYSISFCPGTGEMEITPDDNYVIFSQPGNIFFSCPAPGYFNIYDISQNKLETVKYRADAPFPPFWNLDEVAITPDGQHLIGTSFTAGQIMDYDLQSGEFLQRYEFDFGKMIKTLKIQSNP